MLINKQNQKTESSECQWDSESVEHDRCLDKGQNDNCIPIFKNQVQQATGCGKTAFSGWLLLWDDFMWDAQEDIFEKA